MLRAFGFFIAACVWGFQLTRWLNSGMWPAMPFYPFIDQWLPSQFVLWLMQPRQWPALADLCARLLSLNAGIWIFISASVLQFVVPSSD